MSNLMNVSFPASNDRTQTKTIVIPDLTEVLNVTVNTGNVSYTVNEDNEIELTVSNGAYVSRRTNTGYDYKEVRNQTSSYYSDSDGYSGSLSSYVHTPEDFRLEYSSVSRTGTRNLRCDGSSWSVTSETSFSYPHSISYSSGGYSGTLDYQYSSSSAPINGGDSCDVNGRTTSQTLSGTGYYSGYVTKPAVYRYEGIVSRSYTYYDDHKYAYEVTITYIENEKVGSFKITLDSSVLSLPIYNPLVGMDGKNQLRISLDSAVNSFKLVDLDDTQASPLRIQTSDGVKALAKD